MTCARFRPCRRTSSRARSCRIKETAMNTNRRKSLAAVGCGVALALGTGAASAESSGMDWLGIVYLWGSGIDVDAKNASAGISFGDLIDNLEMAGMAHVEA